MEIAVDFEGDVLEPRLVLTVMTWAPGRGDNRPWRRGRVHQAGAPQTQQDLLDIVVWPLLLGKLARRDRPLPARFARFTDTISRYSAQVVTRMESICHNELWIQWGGKGGSDGKVLPAAFAAYAARFSTHAHPHLHAEHVLPGWRCSHNSAVDVPHHQAAVEIGTEAPCTPGHTASALA